MQTSRLRHASSESANVRRDEVRRVICLHRVIFMCQMYTQTKYVMWSVHTELFV